MSGTKKRDVVPGLPPGHSAKGPPRNWTAKLRFNNRPVDASHGPLQNTPPGLVIPEKPGGKPSGVPRLHMAKFEELEEDEVGRILLTWSSGLHWFPFC